MQSNMRDPAAGIPGQVLPHLHLVSKYRYPSVSALSLETVVNHLLEAPKIVRDIQPMQWMFLDAPADGTVLLVWQPLEYVGTNYASDGYVWADPEHAFNHEARGYTVEMYMHRSGFHPPNETISGHCRKRYRLMPGKVPNPNLPNPDPSLWIIHYSKAERRDHFPSGVIQVVPQIQQMLNQRAFLLRQGQLTRKEFMLHDKNNWPTINFPGQPGSTIAGSAGLAPPQQAFARGQVGPAPNRTAGRHGRGTSISLAAEPTLEEEEDVSRGDLLDFLTPREISKMRYEQHHEWMEEIMGSPYNINQIVPVELGLGRKGALEELTNGFFTAPTSAMLETSTDGVPARVGKMDAGKVETFRRNAEEKLAGMAAELEQMKKQHVARMALLQKSSLYTNAERRLRNAVEDPASPSTDALRLERGRTNTDMSQEPREKVGDIVSEVESKLNKMAVAIDEVTCIHKGGLEEKIEEPEPAVQDPSDLVSDGGQEPDVDMENTGIEATPRPETETAPMQLPVIAATESPLPDLSSTVVPTSQGNESVNTPAGDAPPDAGPIATESDAIPSLGDMDVDMDMDMAGIDNEEDEAAETAEGNVDDWVMVNDNNNAEATAATAVGSNEAPESNTELAQAATTTPGFMDTPGSGLIGLTPAAENQAGSVESAESDNAIDSGNFDISGDFENIDSAGDAMAVYDDEQGDLDLGDLENSAFGDAFHPGGDDERPAEHDEV